MFIRISLLFFAIILFLSCAYFGYELLNSNKISGASFVTLIIAFAVIGLVISFSSEVQEFSVAGNIVKLKEVKEDVIKSINELKLTRIATFSFLLSLARRLPGGWGDSSIIDSRLSDFWFLFKNIKEYNLDKELKYDIKKTVDILTKGQLNLISSYSTKIQENHNVKNIVPNPKDLYIDGLDNDSLNEAIKRNVCDGSLDKLKRTLINGIEEYKKLFTLYEEYKK